MNKMWIWGFGLILLSLAGIYIPVLIAGTNDPFVIFEATFNSISFWIFCVIGTVGAFLCYFGTPRR